MSDFAHIDEGKIWTRSIPRSIQSDREDHIAKSYKWRFRMNVKSLIKVHCSDNRGRIKSTLNIYHVPSPPLLTVPSGLLHHKAFTPPWILTYTHVGLTFRVTLCYCSGGVHSILSSSAKMVFRPHLWVLLRFQISVNTPVPHPHLGVDLRYSSMTGEEL